MLFNIRSNLLFIFSSYEFFFVKRIFNFVNLEKSFQYFSSKNSPTMASGDGVQNESNLWQKTSLTVGQLQK